MVPAMVRRHWQSSCEISYIQGLEPESAGKHGIGRNASHTHAGHTSFSHVVRRASLRQIAMNLEVDRDRLAAEIEELAAISEAAPPAVTRIVFSPTDLKA